MNRKAFDSDLRAIAVFLIAVASVGLISGGVFLIYKLRNKRLVDKESSDRSKSGNVYRQFPV
nr:7kDa-protein [Grapevine leafroll-associated virus 13]